MNIKVNGKDVPFPDARMTYDRLCLLAGVDVEQNPSATYRMSNGTCGILWRGNTAPVAEGGRFSVYHTGMA